MFVASFAELDGATQWLRVSSQGGFQERATPLPLLRLASNSMFLFFHTQETNTAKLPNWGGNSIQPGIHMATLSTAGKDLDLQSLGLSKRSSVVDALLDQSTQSLYLSIDYHSELQLNKQKLQPKQGAHSTLITKWKYGNKPPAFVWQAKVEGLTQSIYESRSVRMLLRQGGGLYALINFNRGSVQLGTSLSLKTDREQATAITVMNENGSWLKALSLEGSNTVEACDALSIDNFLYVTGRFTRKLSWQNKEYLSLGDHDFWAMSLNY